MLTKTSVSVATGLMLAANVSFANSVDFSVFLPSQFPTTKAETHFAEQITARTNGKVKFNITYGGALGSNTEMLDFVTNGIVGGATFPATEYTAQLPSSKVFDMPLLFKDANHARDLQRKLLETVPEVTQSYDALNLKPFVHRGLDPYRLLCNKKIESLEDFKGTKVRVFGSVYPQIFKELGATPVATSSGEVYEAMQRGVVDCAVFSTVAHLVFRVHEVAKFEIDFNFGSIAGYFTYLNKDLYDGFNDVEKAEIDVISAESEAIAEKVLDQLIGSARTAFDAKLNRVAFADGAEIHAMFPKDRILDLYLESMEKHGDDQKQIAALVAEFLRRELSE